MRKIYNRATTAALAAAVYVTLAASAHAAPAGGTNAMPWESGLTQISASLQGPVAYAVSIIGFIVAGIGFVIQGEMTGIAKKLVQAVMGIAILLSVVTLINNFFGVSAAVF